MTDDIVMIEVEGCHKATGAVVTFRFCDGLAYRLRPSEAPANALYRSFLVDAGWCRVDVFSRPGQFGHITPGEAVLDDSSGTLGAELINYTFAGRSYVQRIGRRGAAYPAGYVTTINGACHDEPSFDWAQITFQPADLTASLRKPLQTLRYAGNNALPAGVEGVDDLKGKVKPIVLALASNMRPVLVNTAKLIYHVSIPVGALTVAVSAVRDKGVPLTVGAAYASMAALLDDAQAPAAGAFKVLSTTADGCYFRLGLKPSGEVTCDAAYGAAGDRTHGKVWKRILELGGVASASISSTDITALDTALSAEIEYALFDEIEVDAAATEVATSAHASWRGDEVGNFRITQWTAPSGAPVATLTSLRTESIDIADSIGNGEVAPAYLVSLECAKNWAVQGDANLGGDKASATDTVRAPGGRAGLAARAWLGDEYRVVKTAEDAVVKARYRKAVELKFTSLIADLAAAQVFVDSLLAMYNVARHVTPLRQWLSPQQIADIRPGAVVTVKEERWGYDAGRLMRVAGVEIDRATGETELTCWG